MSDEEIQRIIDYRIQPINISVHSTDPALRRQLLNNKNAGRILEYVDRFAEHGMHMNSQIVVCPELNDGESLSQSLEDLAKRYPFMETVSVVPVGLTKFRENLSKIRMFTREEAEETIGRIEKIQGEMLEEHGTRFAFASDEFYLRAGRPLPPAEDYEGFRQLENGVGMLRLFLDQARLSWNLQGEGEGSGKISVATGVSAGGYIKELVDQFVKDHPTLDVKVHTIKNRFFGENITVTGLIAGRDLIEQLKREGCHKIILIPENMLKRDEPVFLDDITVEEAMKELDARIIPVPVDGGIFIDRLKSQ